MQLCIAHASLSCRMTGGRGCVPSLVRCETIMTRNCSLQIGWARNRQELWYFNWDGLTGVYWVWNELQNGMSAPCITYSCLLHLKFAQLTTIIDSKSQLDFGSLSSSFFRCFQKIASILFREIKEHSYKNSLSVVLYGLLCRFNYNVFKTN